MSDTPPLATPLVPQNTDLEHLKLLSIFHYVVAGLTALFACIPIIHLVMGLFMLLAPHGFGPPQGRPPVFLGLFFVGFASFFILAGWALAILIFLAGRFLAARTHYRYCFVVACVQCVFMPFGTVLGVFTIIVLIRDSVKSLFTPRPS